MEGRKEGRRHNYLNMCRSLHGSTMQTSTRECLYSQQRHYLGIKGGGISDSASLMAIKDETSTARTDLVTDIVIKNYKL